jgi:branched-chain amino acid transport system permease protein
MLTKASRTTFLVPLRDGVLAGLVALVLAFPIVGLPTSETAHGLVLRPRIPEAIAFAVAVFLGRFALGVAEAGKPRPILLIALLVAIAAPFASAAPEFGAALAIGGLFVALRSALLAFPGVAGRISGGIRVPPVAIKRAPLVLLLLLVVLPLTPVIDRRLLDIAVLVLTYVMLGWGLNITVGLAGLLDLGYVAFFAIGAYAYALLSLTAGLSFWGALPIAGLCAAAAGLIVGGPILRLRGDYFAIVTLGFGEIVRLVAINWSSLTGGSQGIAQIPRISFFGLADFTATPDPGRRAFHELFGISFDPAHRQIFIFYVILALALAVNAFIARSRKLPLGRAWEALREDEIAAQSLGLNLQRIRLSAYAIAAAWGGFAGAFFAVRQGFISPESFSFLESAVILAIVVLGGVGSQLGVVLAAIVMIGVPELVRQLAEYRMLAFGVAMVAIMVWRPSGLISRREPSIRLGDAA